ncbi:MAG TPA: hypothetical protein PK657_08440 [Legionella sp.]|nr:hypothetical protein [Legionella sp.]
MPDNKVIFISPQAIMPADTNDIIKSKSQPGFIEDLKQSSILVDIKKGPEENRYLLKPAKSDSNPSEYSTLYSDSLITIAKNYNAPYLKATNRYKLLELPMDFEFTDTGSIINPNLAFYKALNKFAIEHPGQKTNFTVLLSESEFSDIKLDEFIIPKNITLNLRVPVKNIVKSIEGQGKIDLHYNKPEIADKFNRAMNSLSSKHRIVGSSAIDDFCKMKEEINKNFYQFNEKIENIRKRINNENNNNDDNKEKNTFQKNFESIAQTLENLAVKWDDNNANQTNFLNAAHKLFDETLARFDRVNNNKVEEVLKESLDLFSTMVSESRLPQMTQVLENFTQLITEMNTEKNEANLKKTHDSINLLANNSGNKLRAAASLSLGIFELSAAVGIMAGILCCPLVLLNPPLIIFGGTLLAVTLLAVGMFTVMDGAEKVENIQRDEQFKGAFFKATAASIKVFEDLEKNSILINSQQ